MGCGWVHMEQRILPLL